MKSSRVCASFERSVRNLTSGHFVFMAILLIILCLQGSFTNSKLRVHHNASVTIQISRPVSKLDWLSRGESNSPTAFTVYFVNEYMWLENILKLFRCILLNEYIWLENIFKKNYCAVFCNKFQLLCNFSRWYNLVKWKSFWISRGITVVQNHLLELYLRDRPMQDNPVWARFALQSKYEIFYGNHAMTPRSSGAHLISCKPKFYMVEWLVFLTSGVYFNNYCHFLRLLMISIMIIILNGNVLMATFRAAPSLVLLLSKSKNSFWI